MNLKISLFGESHGEAIGATIQGLPAGIKLDMDFLRSQSELRKPKGKISTKRQEKDDFKIVSGFFNSFTTGTPLTVLIYNENTKSRDYDPSKLRPSHADYTAFEKYNGFQDYRGGGHFSGRITAPLVLAGAIALQVLREKGIIIGKKGKTLMALENILNCIIRGCRIEVNVEDFKEKRNETLREVARKMSEKALATGKTIRLNSMPAKERKIIHEVVNTYSELDTFSEGKEPKRYIVIKRKK